MSKMQIPGHMLSREQRAMLSGTDNAGKAELMKNWYGEEGWDELYPKLGNITDVAEEILADGAVWTQDVTGWLEDEHEKLDRGVWTDRYGGLPYPLCVSLSFYFFILGAEKASYVKEIMSMCGLLVRLDKIVWIDRTKILTDWAKRRGPAVKWWRLLIDLHMLAGFNLKPVGSVEADKIVRNWCEGEYDRAKMTNYDVLPSIADVFDVMCVVKQDAIDTLHNFIAQPDNWVTKGSGKGEKARLWDKEKGEEVIGQSTKAAIATNNSVSAIIAKLFATTKEVFSVSGKIEVGGKGRIIISPGFEFNLLLAYVLKPLETSLSKKRADSPLWTGGDGVVNMWRKVHAWCRSETRWLYPQDVSKFDQTVATDELMKVLLAMKEWVRRRVHGKASMDMRQCINAAIARMSNAYVVLPGSKKTIKWEHGMPSGIRITAVGDTAISLGRCYAVIDKLESDVWGMGDDILVASKTPEWPMALYLRTVEMGVEVNPAKNFISTKHAEFLRVAGDAEIVCGYPARHIVKVLFYDQGEMKPVKGDISWVRARVESYWLFAARGCDLESVLYAIKGTVLWAFGQNGLTWINTHSALGGAGVIPLIENGIIPLAGDNDVGSRYVALEEGAYSDVCDRTIKFGVSKEEVLEEVGSRAARGMPKGQTGVVQKWEETIAPRRDTVLSGTMMKAFQMGVAPLGAWPQYNLDRQSVGAVFGGLVIGKLVEDGSWGIIIDSASALCRDFARWLFKVGERKLFILWVKSKLPTPSPKINGWGSQGTAYLCEIACAVRDKWLKQKHRVSMLDYIVGTVTAEDCVVDYALSAKLKLGF